MLTFCGNFVLRMHRRESWKPIDLRRRIPRVGGAQLRSPAASSSHNRPTALPNRHPHPTHTDTPRDPPALAPQPRGTRRHSLSARTPIARRPICFRGQTCQRGLCTQLARQRPPTTMLSAIPEAAGCDLPDFEALCLDDDAFPMIEPRVFRPQACPGTPPSTTSTLSFWAAGGFAPASSSSAVRGTAGALPSLNSTVGGSLALAGERHGRGGGKCCRLSSAMSAEFESMVRDACAAAGDERAPRRSVVTSSLSSRAPAGPRPARPARRRRCRRCRASPTSTCLTLTSARWTRRWTLLPRPRRRRAEAPTPRRRPPAAARCLCRRRCRLRRASPRSSRARRRRR